MNHAPLYRRLLAKIEVNANGCWIFIGSIGNGGYGQIFYQGRLRQAHIAAYLWYRGAIPEGFELDHFWCDTRKCCNPWHCEAVTPAMNMRRSQAPGAILYRAARCKRGHAMVEGNIYYRKSKGRLGQRECLICLHLRNANRAKVWGPRASTVIKNEQRITGGMCNV